MYTESYWPYGDKITRYLLKAFHKASEFDKKIEFCISIYRNLFYPLPSLVVTAKTSPCIKRISTKTIKKSQPRTSKIISIKIISIKYKKKINQEQSFQSKTTKRYQSRTIKIISIKNKKNINQEQSKKYQPRTIKIISIKNKKKSINQKQ